VDRHAFPECPFLCLHEGVPGSTRVLFASNHRDPRAFDVLEADFAARRVREIARNDGKILRWVVDTDGKLQAAFGSLARKMDRIRLQRWRRTRRRRLCGGGL